mgnify:CR=1 FL=1
MEGDANGNTIPNPSGFAKTFNWYILFHKLKRELSDMTDQMDRMFISDERRGGDAM